MPARKESQIPFLWGGWKEEVTYTPPYNFFISPKNLKHVGFFETSHQHFIHQNVTNDGSKLDPLYKLFDPTLIKCGTLTHGWVKTTWQSISKQFLMFDKPIIQQQSIFKIY